MDMKKKQTQNLLDFWGNMAFYGWLYMKLVFCELFASISVLY